MRSFLPRTFNLSLSMLSVAYVTFTRFYCVTYRSSVKLQLRMKDKEFRDEKLQKKRSQKRSIGHNLVFSWHPIGSSISPSSSYAVYYHKWSILVMICKFS